MRIQPFIAVALTVFFAVRTGLTWEDAPSPPPETEVQSTEAVTALQPSTKPVSLSAFLNDVAENTELNGSIKSMGARRNVRAAEMLEMEMRITQKLRGKPQELNLFQISKVLSRDFHREDLHTRFIELAVKDYRDWGNERPEYLLEQIWQEKEYLRLAGAEKDSMELAASSTKDLPPRESPEFKPVFLSNAKNTFESGFGIHIEYDGKPIVIDDSVGLTSEDLMLKYVRSPNYPPRGCRVVAKLVFNQKGKDAVFAYHGEYLPCAFSSGLLRGQFVVLGGLPQEADATLLVFVTSHYNDESSPPIPVSNMLSVPVLQKPTAAPSKDIPTIDTGDSFEAPKFSIEKR